MKLSTRTLYGLRMLSQLAAEYDRGSIQIGVIGEREGISRKYLGQIMLLLRSSGLVQSVRGAQGGYFLSRPPENIGLLEIFELLEGEILDFGDTENSGTPPSRGGQKNTHASTNELWIRVREAIKEVLGSYTLADIQRLGLFKAGYTDYTI